MKVRYKHGHRNSDLNIGEAVMQITRTEADHRALLARLVYTLHKKGLLLPDEVLTVLGTSYERAD